MSDLINDIKRDLHLVLSADPVLREQAAPVVTFKAPFHALVGRMRSRMAEWGGVGLAAPQVGLSLQLFVVAQVQDAFINPAVRPVKPAGQDTQIEGCLSFPGKKHWVQRWREVDVVYVNQYAVLSCLRFDGFLARVIQHEFDHLNGKLIIDHPEESAA